jgi:type II secretory pathway pseudopilin PulG
MKFSAFESIKPESSQRTQRKNTSQSSWSLCLSGKRSSPAFSTIELLVVIFIIAILMALLLPAINHVRLQSYVSATNEELSAISSACESYFTAFNAYPGPFGEADIAGTVVAGVDKGKVTYVTNGTTYYVTGTQNMLIGLMGTLYTSNAGLTAGNYVTITDSYNTTTSYVTTPLGSGPIDYSTGATNGTPKASYYSPPAGLLLSTYYGSLPTLYDQFPDGLPVLYYRKNPGMPGTSGYPVSQDSTTPNTVVPAAFYLGSNSVYTAAATISARDAVPYSQTNSSYNDSTSGYMGANAPAYATDYFAGVVFNSTLVTQPTSGNDGSVGTWPPTTSTYPGPPAWPNNLANPVQGGFVLISAGIDHLYGVNAYTAHAVGSTTETYTPDDIVVFGGQ